MARIHVVGSGASGVHFALSRLEEGDEVVMIDVGYASAPSVAEDLTFTELKENLSDPAAYFLGGDFEGVLLPSLDPDLYGIPPSKGHVLRRPPGFDYEARGFSPLSSFARGGLAEAWTAGCYAYNDDDLSLFPFSSSDIAPHYDEVARRIGVNGARDDLTRFIPVPDPLLPPLALDTHSKRLFAQYQMKRQELNEELGFFMGRSRVATLTEDQGDRKACRYLGRCLWGCPVGALYTPSETLRECHRHPRFTYVSNVLANHFLFKGKRVRGLVVKPLDGHGSHEIPVDTLVLAAGALGTSEIVLNSVHLGTGEILALRGLMDNRQVYLPFINLKMIGQAHSSASYQYHLLGIGLPGSDPTDYVHGQITTLKAALMHPIVQRLPFDLATANAVARAAHGALGIVNVNFRDLRREENFVTLTPRPGHETLMLAIRYTPPRGEKARIRPALRRIRKAMRKLGCIVPPGMTQMRAIGTSVHYAGTLPMTLETAPWTTNEVGQSREFENLFVVDGASFPFLPAKNPTFTLMANAVRIARSAF